MYLLKVENNLTKYKKTYQNIKATYLSIQTFGY
jgi:hypothetical protein